MKVNERIKYLKENYESLSVEDLKEELKETKSKTVTQCLESLISIKEADSVDVEFTIGHGGARKGAGRKTEEKRNVAWQLKTTVDRRKELKEKLAKITKFYNYSGGDLTLLALLNEVIEKNNL